MPLRPHGHAGKPAPRFLSAWCVLFLACLLGLCAYRAWTVDLAYGWYVDCRGCLRWPTFASDLWLVAALVGGLALASWSRARWLVLPIALAGVALLLVIEVDLVVGATLSRRLRWDDVPRWGGDFAAQRDIVLPFLSSVRGFSLVAASLLSLVSWLLACRASLRHARQSGSGLRAPRVAAIAVLALIASAAAWAGGGAHYLHAELYENVVKINQRDASRREHSPERLAELKAMPEPPRRCLAGAGGTPSVILVAAESWSMHHSRLYSGLADLTPKLDALAQQGAWYPEFYANGYATETGLIALLTGKSPLPTHRAWGIFAFDEVEYDFHRWLATRGYHTALLTSATVEPGKRREWAQMLGIAFAEGAEQQPRYANLPHGVFGAASDAALVDRFLDWYDHERPPGPFMATIVTVSTHPPFIDVDTSDPDLPGEQAAFARLDKDLARLAEALRTRGFLEHGILFVAGDHRAMTPVGTGELDRFGEDVMSRVPAFALGAIGRPPGPVAGAFQQTDLIPSLRERIGTEVCVNAMQGLMFGANPEPPKVIAYPYPMVRDELHVQTGGARYRMRLDGDDTRWLGDAPPDGKRIADELMRERVSHDQW